MLRAEHTDASRRHTLLHDLRLLSLTPSERHALAHGSFVVHGGHRPFLTSILDRAPGSPDVVLRYDPCCMTPATPSAQTAALLLMKKTTNLDPVTIEWFPGRTVVLDNWRVLHARAAPRRALQRDARTLQRILVWPGASPPH